MIRGLMVNLPLKTFGLMVVVPAVLVGCNGVAFAPSPASIEAAARAEAYRGPHITFPEMNTPSRTGLDLGGVCETGLPVTINGPGMSGQVSADCSDGRFAANVVFAGADGTKNIVVAQTLDTNDLRTDNRDFIKDNTPPTIRIQAPEANQEVGSQTQVRGVCEQGLTVVLTDQGSGANLASVPCISNQFQANINLPGADGLKSIRAAQVDLVGNQGVDTQGLIKDTTAPLVRITGPAQGAVSSSGLTVSGTCEGTYSVYVFESGSTSTPLETSCTSGVFSQRMNFSAPDGAKMINVYQSDRAGNRGTDSRQFVRDATAPLVKITLPVAMFKASNGLTLEGTCETGLNVNLSGSGLAASINTQCLFGKFTQNINFSAGDGIKSISATQTDSAGNIGSDSRDFMRDSTGPNVTIADPAANTEAQSGVLVRGLCEDGFAVRLDGPGVSSVVNATCSGRQYSANVVFSGGDGVKQVTASQTDESANTSTVTRNFIKDTTAPVVRITSPATGSSARNSVLVSGTCESGYTVSLSEQGQGAQTQALCSNGTFSGSVSFSAADGQKIVVARQTDTAGNTGSDSRSFVRDNAGPAIAILRPAANTSAATGITLEGSCEAGFNVVILGAGVQAQVVTSCAAGTFSQAVNFSAGDGIKSITATQTDGAGNTGSASRDFVRDTSGPAINITSPAANAPGKDGLLVEGTCENGLSVQIAGSGVANPQAVTCVSQSFQANVVFTNGDGVKSVTATQTDSVGNRGVASRDFLRDTTAPLISISTPLANASVRGDVTVSGTCESNLSVSVSEAGNAGAPTVVSCSSGVFSALVSLSAGDGVKTLIASQTDAVGNVGSDSRSVSADTSGPAISIVQPAALTVVTTSLTLEGTCESGLVVVIGGAGVSSSLTTSCAGGTFTQVLNLSNGEGNKQITVSQTDSAGNVGSDSRTFIRDTLAPVVTINSPAENTEAINGLTIQGSCEDGFMVEVSGAGVASTQDVLCSSRAYSASVVYSNGDGTKNVVVSQTDAVGNRGTASRNFVRDTLAPVVRITNPAAGTSGRGSLAVSGTCESGLQVQLSEVGGAQAPVMVACSSGNFSGSVTFSSGDGAKSILASQTDRLGNVGSDTRSFNNDSTGPQISILRPDALTVAQTGVTIEGSCEAGLTVTLGGSGISASTTTPCSSGTFSKAILFSSGDGTKTVTASQTDGANNTNSDSRNFIRDTIAPPVRITGPAAGSSTSSGLTLVGTCENGLPVNLSGTGLSSAQSVSCSSGTFSVAVTFSSGEGAKNIVVTQTDAAGNLGTDNRSFVRDSISPVIVITSPASGTSTSTGLTVSGNCENGLAVNLTGDLRAPLTATCAGGVFSSAVAFSSGDGAKIVRASQTDAAGNLGSDSRSFIANAPDFFETFMSTTDKGKVDILIVDDNSVSMSAEQASMGSKFNSFITGLGRVDWQIGITTTDCGTGLYGICGSILQLTGSQESILTPLLPNPSQLFLDTMKRPETLACEQGTGPCPDGLEQPLKAMISAMNKRNAENAGLFRDGADLAIVVLSDEDEMSNGRAIATKPQAVIDQFNGIWGNSKKLSVYGIIIKPGDSACLRDEERSSGGVAFYGTHVDELSRRTGGLTGSICDADYGSALTAIGQTVKRITESVVLSRAPNPASLVINFTPAFSTTWTVQDTKIIFTTPPPADTKIDVYYDAQ